MNYNLDNVKYALGISLQKHGSSVDELEAALQNGVSFERATKNTKLANALTDFLALTSTAAGKAGLAAGALGGVGGYAAFDHMKDTDEGLTKLRMEHQKVLEANAQLKQLLAQSGYPV